MVGTASIHNIRAGRESEAQRLADNSRTGRGGKDNRVTIISSFPVQDSKMVQAVLKQLSLALEVKNTDRTREGQRWAVWEGDAGIAYLEGLGPTENLLEEEPSLTPLAYAAPWVKEIIDKVHECAGAFRTSWENWLQESFLGESHDENSAHFRLDTIKRAEGSLLLEENANQSIKNVADLLHLVEGIDSEGRHRYLARPQRHLPEKAVVNLIRPLEAALRNQDKVTIYEWLPSYRYPSLLPTVGGEMHFSPWTPDHVIKFANMGKLRQTSPQEVKRFAGLVPDLRNLNLIDTQYSFSTTPMVLEKYGDPNNPESEARRLLRQCVVRLGLDVDAEPFPIAVFPLKIVEDNPLTSIPYDAS
jgi:hypothetical protein